MSLRGSAAEAAHPLSAETPAAPARADPSLSVQVTGGGSGTGAASLINGTTDLANLSRPMKDGERKQLQEKYGSPGVEIKVARDGLSIFLNRKDPVDSGTYEYFKDHVLEKQDFAATVQSLPGTAGVVNAVAKDEAGIGFGGAAFGEGIKFALVKADPATPAYAPTQEHVVSGSHPISRYLYIYTRRQPEGKAKAFIDWNLSDGGQGIVANAGYFPLRAAAGAVAETPAD